MLDQTSINNFIVENKIVNGMMIFDKGFYNEDLFERKLNKKYSYKQIFKMLSKYKKVRTDRDAPWEDVTKLKYIEELTKILDV